MTRTQIYLSPDLESMIDRLSRETGQTKSELIRQALRKVYLGEEERMGLLEALLETSGAWKGRRGNGRAYVESLRRGRLARRVRR